MEDRVARGLSSLPSLGLHPRSLAEYPLPVALADIYHRRATGRLVLQRGGKVRRIFMRRGSPVQFESNSAEDSLEQFLVARGVLDQVAAYRARSKAVETDRSVGDVLIEQRDLGPNELYKALKLHMGACILGLFEWPDGEVRFEEGDLPTGGDVPLEINPGPLILRGVLSRSTPEVIRQHFQGLAGDRFQLSADSGAPLHGLQLNSRQTRIARCLESPCQLDELAERAGVDQEEALRVLFSLLLLKVAHSVGQPASDGPDRGPAGEPPGLSAGPAPPAPHGPLADAASPQAAPCQAAPPEPSLPQRRGLDAEERRALEEAHRLARSGTYYQLLGVDPMAGFEELKQAFLARCHQLSPMSLADRRLGSRQAMVEELFLYLVRAFSTLTDGDQRRAYNARIGFVPPAHAAAGEGAPRDHRPRRAPSRQDHAKIPAGPAAAQARAAAGRPAPDAAEQRWERSNMFAVEEPFQASTRIKTAIVFLNAGQVREAVEELTAAARESPEDADALCLLGFTLFLLDPVTSISAASSHLKRASALAPEAYEPYLYWGRICEYSQDWETALGVYQQALARAPRHPEVQAAVQRLRTLLRR